ncbi:MAG: ABC transporter permease, partial [Thermoplasmata archaeon]
MRHEDEDEYLPAATISPGLLALLGVRPLLGRDFTPNDTLPGAEAVVMLDYEFWRTRLGGDETVVGSPIAGVDPATREAKRARVIAVLPKGFRLRGPAAVWMPLRVPSRAVRTTPGAYVIARLAAGINATAANAELATISRRLALQYPGDYTKHGAVARPLRALFGDPSAGAGSRELFAIMSVVLLIAAANVAGLFFARAEARRHELAVRGALGASRRSLVGLLLTEALCLAAAGGVLGTFASIWGVRLAGAALGSDALGLVARVDWRVLAFVSLVSLLVGLTTGLLPAIGVARSDLIQSLRGGRQDRSARLGWGGKSLVVMQTACSLSLLAAATSLGRDFVRLRYQAPGFDPHRLYMVGISLPGASSMDVEQLRLRAFTARERIASLPGVASAAVEIPGAPEQVRVDDADEAIPMAKSPLFHAVDGGFFHDVGIPLISGRAFSVGDKAGAPPVAILNEAAAKLFWPGQEAIGRRLLVGDSDTTRSWLTVV